MRFISSIVAAIMVGCGSYSRAADEPAKDLGPIATAPAPRLWAGIGVPTPVVLEGASDGLTLLFALVNDSDKAVNPEFDNAKLVINGKEFPAVPEAPWVRGGLGGGSRMETLRPKDWAAFGRGLQEYFRKPGLYRVSCRGSEFGSAEVVFRVLPRDGITGSTAKKGARTLWAGIGVSSALMQENSANGIRIRLGLINDGDTVADPQAVESKLIVNGKDIPVAPAVLQPGAPPRDIQRKLEPGASTEFELGPQRFLQEPGVYRISWKGKHFQSAEAVVRVVQRKK
jgi:hypothetical protein